MVGRLQSRRFSGYQSLRRTSDTKTGSILCPPLLRGTSQKEATIEEDAESTFTSYNKYRWVWAVGGSGSGQVRSVVGDETVLT